MYRYAPFYKFIFGSIFLLFLNTAYSQFSVNTGATAMQMAQELVGPGVDVISATYVGDGNSKGIFTAFATSLPEKFHKVVEAIASQRRAAKA